MVPQRHISMVNQKLFIFIFLLSSFPSKLTSAELCHASQCNGYGSSIRFPFHVKSVNHKKTCEYPGFQVTCTPNQTLIQVPHSGDFTIQEIDYIKQEVLLNDPKNCLSKRLLTLNLTDSPFEGVHYQKFALYNCSGQFVNYFKYVAPIVCLSGLNFSVFAVDPDVGLRLFSSCDLTGILNVPVRSLFFEEDTSDLSEDIRLSWSQPNCTQCVQNDGWCGLKSSSSGLEVQCYGHQHQDLHALTIGLGVPSLIFLLAILFFVLIQGFRRRTNSETNINLVRTAVVQSSPDLTGLDQLTIESYPKVVLGESRRVPEPNDNICPICLSEYQPKETLRALPECSHCFHADCIDEWLHNHGTCPVCRNSLLNDQGTIVSSQDV